MKNFRPLVWLVVNVLARTIPRNQPVINAQTVRVPPSPAVMLTLMENLHAKLAQLEPLSTANTKNTTKNGLM
jgi:hypothetical protein